MAGIGIAACAGTGCECVTECPECCAPTSISFWATVNTIENADYTCDACPSATPYEIELTEISCANSDPWNLPTTHCIDPDECTYTSDSGDPCDTILEPTGTCVKKCYKVEYSTPCIECVPVLDGTTYYSRVDYCIFIAFGRITVTVGAGTETYDCAMYVRYFIKYYQGDSCETLTLKYIGENTQVLEMDTADCCTEFVFDPTAVSCFRYCTLSYQTFPCGIAQAIATVPNPEWDKLSLNC